MRPAHICSLEEANDFSKSYLPNHNQKFLVAPKVPSPAYRADPHLEALNQIFCRKEIRLASYGSTISFRGKTYHSVENNRVVLPTPKTKVQVHTYSDGRPQACY